MVVTATPDGASARIAQLFAWPILLASLGTAVGLLLALSEGVLGEVGNALVTAGAVVIMAEPVALFVATADKRRWFQQHRWLILVATIVLVSFAVGLTLPLHLLRLLRGVGSSHFLYVLNHAAVTRVSEFGYVRGNVHAGALLPPPVRVGLEVLIVALVPVYAYLSLRDPNGASRELLRDVELLPVTHPRWLVAIAVLVLVVQLARRVKARHETRTESPA